MSTKSPGSKAIYTILYIVPAGAVVVVVVLTVTEHGADAVSDCVTTLPGACLAAL